MHSAVAIWATGDGWKAMLALRVQAEADALGRRDWEQQPDEPADAMGVADDRALLKTPIDVAIGDFDFGIGAVVRRQGRYDRAIDLHESARSALLLAAEIDDFRGVQYDILEDLNATSRAELLNLKNIPELIRFLIEP